MNKGNFKKQNFQKGQHPNDGKTFNKKKKFKDKKKRRGGGGRNQRWEDTSDIELGQLTEDERFNDFDSLLKEFEERFDADAEPLNFLELYGKPIPELREVVEAAGCTFDQAPGRQQMMDAMIARAGEHRQPIRITGVLDLPEEDEDYGILCYEADNYRIKGLSAFVAPAIVRKFGLERGHVLEVDVAPHRENESCPYVLQVRSVMGLKPESVSSIEPFTELVPYYPTDRILLETPAGADVKITWDNNSMRVVDCVSPVGFGQRGLIVAPPRTGKTVLLQGMAHAVQNNFPEAHLIVLLVDERPEEVTDFKRQVTGEVISSTFDEKPESHVHAAEMVIEKARRMVECGRDVVILLDSITRLARAYNTMMPNSGKILSGGVEANALQKPKRFFGSARNIEGGGSLTIIATALVETGSKMDEVIFEEFKGTGNMELHLDRELINKRIFPALDFDKSGTRKEELLYHPDEMQKIHSLRRAMKGVPGPEAMEMLIQRIKKTKSNAEFLMALSR
ncbi:MAG: transcription termination factor Rho [Opitutales bacterium]